MLIVILKIPVGSSHVSRGEDERHVHATAWMRGDLWQQPLISAFPFHVLLFLGQVDGVTVKCEPLQGPPVKESRTGAKTWKENSTSIHQMQEEAAAQQHAAINGRAPAPLNASNQS